MDICGTGAEAVGNFASLLRELMEGRGLTKEGLATLVWGDPAGLRPFQIGARRDKVENWLAGRQIPNPEDLRRLSGALGEELRFPDLEARDARPEELAMEQVTGREGLARLRMDMVLPAHLAARIVAMATDPALRPGGPAPT